MQIEWNDLEALFQAIEHVDSVWHTIVSPLPDDLHDACKNLCDELDYFYGAPRPDGSSTIKTVGDPHRRQ